jgi:AmmeMemoRadiSam system protein B
MTKKLPPLRPGLDLFPSPLTERPGLLIRDPLRYSEEILIIPPLLASGLLLFDGERTAQDLRAHLEEIIGQQIAGEIVDSFVEALEMHGFLETEEFETRRRLKHAEFAAARERSPAHAGLAYPDDERTLREQLDRYLHETSKSAAATAGLIGIAAPHVSLEGGWRCYASAYGRLGGGVADSLAGRTIVLLGTSHYGAPESFGLTRKPFVTPLGEIGVDQSLVDRLAARAGAAVVMEDYCHAIEHSIEFQCLFLQQLLGADFRILPILCGPLAESLRTGRSPGSNKGVRRFFDALREIAAVERERLFWVLGIDLAHVGRRYGDPLDARAESGPLIEVRERDAERLGRVCAGDHAGFFELLAPNRDDLKWCGYSPLYTFLKTAEFGRGEVLRYDQWNIDERSVVSFAALEFSARAR